MTVSRPEVAVPSPGAHGGDARALAAALDVPVSEILDLSSTMNPFAPDVVALVRRFADEVQRYPDPWPATKALADALGVDPSRVLLTNGGAEAIALVAAELRHAAIVEPEFSLWRRHLEAVDDPSSATAGRVRSNPNNPSGALAAPDEVAVAWDEAFFPLATGRWTRGDADNGSLVVGSLTKLFSCPGLRLGYVVAPDLQWAQRVAARQPLWSVNGVAVGVLPTLLECVELARWARELAGLRARLTSVFEARGFDVVSADAPWVLIRQASWLRSVLARQGVLVRDCGSFGLHGTLRVAVHGEAGIARLSAALGRTEIP